MAIVFNLVKNCEEQEILWLACDWLVTTATHERPHEEHMLEVQMTQVSKAINNCFMCVSLFPFFLYLHYKSLNYPQNCKKSFRKKTLEIHWRVRDCKPTIIYTFLLVFFTIFPLPLSYLKRRFYPNTTHT